MAEPFRATRRGLEVRLSGPERDLLANLFAQLDDLLDDGKPVPDDPFDELAALSGLAGLGDLIATCESPLSRNNTAGRLLGQGYAYGEVIAQMNQTAEGLSSVAPILELAASRGVEMPIVSQVAEVLAGTLNPRDIAPHLTTDTNEPQGE